MELYPIEEKHILEFYNIDIEQIFKNLKNPYLQFKFDKEYELIDISKLISNDPLSILLDYQYKNNKLLWIPLVDSIENLKYILESISNNRSISELVYNVFKDNGFDRNFKYFDLCGKHMILKKNLGLSLDESLNFEKHCLYTLLYFKLMLIYKNDL